MSQKSFLKPCDADIFRKGPLSINANNVRQRPIIWAPADDVKQRPYYEKCNTILQLLIDFQKEKRPTQVQKPPSFSEFSAFINDDGRSRVEDERLLAQYVKTFKNAYLEKMSENARTGNKTSKIPDADYDSLNWLPLPEQAFYRCDKLWNDEAKWNEEVDWIESMHSLITSVLKSNSGGVFQPPTDSLYDLLRKSMPEFSYHDRYSRSNLKAMVIQKHKIKLDNGGGNIDPVPLLIRKDPKMRGSSTQKRGAPARRDNDDQNAPQQDSGGNVNLPDLYEEARKRIAASIFNFVLISACLDLDDDYLEKLEKQSFLW